MLATGNKVQIFKIQCEYNTAKRSTHFLTQKITLKPKTRYLMTTLTSDRSCLYLVTAFMVKRFPTKILSPVGEAKITTIIAGDYYDKMLNSFIFH